MGTPGRPRIEFDKKQWGEFDKLCALQCTLPEIASYFDCSEDTIERRVKERFGRTFAEVFAQKRGKGKVSLRRAQYAAAIGGDKTMLVWLGKSWLDQTDKSKVEHSGQVGPPKLEIVLNRDEAEPSS